MQHRGFTIVELLIAIVVIGILAAIAIVSYSGIQERAKATAIVSGMRETDKAMRLALLEEDRDVWWDDDDYLDSNGEPALTELIANTALGNYMFEPPKVTGEDDSFWMYDNDNPESNEYWEDAYDPTICPSARRSGGVNLQIELHDHRKLAQIIDDMIDDGNLECGKFREHHENAGEFLYLLSTTQITY